MAYVPGLDLPPEYETGPMSQQMSMQNQFGGVVAQPGIDPLAAQQAADAERARQSVIPNIQAGAGLYQATPSAASPLGAPGLPTEAPPDAVALPNVPAPPAAPGAVPGAAPAHAGGHAGQGMVPQFDQMINQQQAQEQAAAAELANTQRQGGVDQATALKEQQDKRNQLAGDLIKKQQEVQAHNAQLDAIDKANLDKAKNATIPDFWKDRTGALVGSTISVALAGIGAGLLGSTNNEALKNIQHSVDTYFHNQKDRIDNLYKYAEQTGKLNAQTRLNYAQDLLNLKDQHSYVMQSAADHVQEVAAKSKGAADAATTNFLASKLGEQAIKDKQDVRELRSKILLQGAQAEAARGSAAESNARAKQGGYLTPAQTIGMVTQLTGQFKHISDPKTGLAGHVRELGSKLKAVSDNPNNPENTVALVDSMIKSNTGKAAIMSQYNLYTGHAAGANDRPEQILEQFRSGGMSKKQRDTIVQSAQQAYNQMTAEAGEANKQFHEAVAANPNLNNPLAQGLVSQQERAIFGGFPNYGKQETVLAPGQQAPAAAPAQQHNTVVRLKDGTTAEFNAAGQRVK